MKIRWIFLTAGNLATALTAMGLMSKEAENPVLFERAKILDNLDQRFVSVKGHYQADLPQQPTAKRRSRRVRDVVAKWKCSRFLRSIYWSHDSSDSDLCTSLISSSFPSEGQGKRLALGLAWKASEYDVLQINKLVIISIVNVAVGVYVVKRRFYNLNYGYSSRK